jgi:hypothetical protein
VPLGQRNLVPILPPAHPLGGLIRGVAFSRMGLIRGMTFSRRGLIRGVTAYSNYPRLEDTGDVFGYECYRIK